MSTAQSAANHAPCSGAEAVSVGISALSVDTEANSSQASIWQSDESLGAYRLLERIGVGGMGEVWLAEQRQPLRRRVAVKLIKAGMDTREVVARFESERQALAMMDHPTIAKVFDAGSSPQFRPYFAMEYITGIPITQYCDEHNLTLRQRLELFIQVCDGVQHAHHKAIIHRDLKPSNILVSEVDGKHLPRIIDFGVAKAMSNASTPEAEFTRAGVILGTPAYMSPEQAESGGLNVDTRTDVYSLGVILYELLVGARPIDFHEQPFNKILRRLLEEETLRPSAKLRTLGSQSSGTARNRSSDPPTLARNLRGDLDAIALKALEKDRSRRYASPSELIADIGRYLRNEAVFAVPPSLIYRSRKFVRRYRFVLATISAFVLVLLAAAIVSIRQSIRAKSEAGTAQAISDFLRHDLLAQAGTWSQWGLGAKADPDLKVRTALDRAAARVNGRFGQQPDVEAAVRDTIGQTYGELKLFREAQKQFERVVELRQRTLGADNPDTLKAMSGLASTLTAEGMYADAEQMLAQILGIQRRVLGPQHPDTLDSMHALGTLYREQGKYLQAENLLSEVLQLSRRVFGPEDIRTLDCMDRLAETYYLNRKYQKAETLSRQVFEIRCRVLGPEHPDTTVSLSDLGNIYLDQGNFTAAEALYRETLEIRRRVVGAEHPFAMAAMNNLAEAYSGQGKYAQAEMLDNQAFEMRRRVLGPENPETLMSMGHLAADYADERKYSQAEALFGQTLDIHRRTSGLQSRHALYALSDAAFMYQREGKYALAEAYASQVHTAWQHTLGTGNAITMDAAADLLTAYLSQGKFVKSEPLARQAVEFDRKNRAESWERFRAEILLGASLAGQKKYIDAELLLLGGYQGMRARRDQIAVPNWYHLDRAREWIIDLYHAWGKPKKVAEWKKM